MALAAAEMRARLSDIASALPELELLVLFGSTATGRATRRSDVDVAVGAAALADLDAVYMALAPRLETDRLDLVDVRRAGPLLAF